MLAEKITFPGDFPINIRIGTVTEDPIHYQSEIELVFMLKGQLQLKNGCSNYLLKQGDLFTVNCNEIHALHSTDKENLTAIIQFSTRYYSQFFPDLADSCFHSHSIGEANPAQDKLKHIVLTLLLNYLKKSLNYKQECADLGEEIIDCLRSHFSLFTFDNNTITNAPGDDPVQTERLTRILNKVHIDYAGKLSLEQIAEEEGLSLFYLSHLIHDFIGLNFRELLCFARAEASEHLLLDPDKKVSAIAKAVGFSTTAYYEKFFHKWYNQTPEEYRRQYIHTVKSTSRKEKFEEEPVSNAIFVVRRLLSVLEGHIHKSRKTTGIRAVESIDARGASIKKVRPEVYITITLQDYQVLKHQLFQRLDLLNPKVLYLAHTPEDDPALLQEFKDCLAFYNYSYREKLWQPNDEPPSFGKDSIAMLPQILTHGILGNSPIRVPLCDTGSPDALQLQGKSGLLTSSGMPKPAFYACAILSKLNGDLLSWNDGHAVIRAGDSYIIVIFNYDEETDRICTEPSSLRETEDIITHFHSQLDMNITLKGLDGKYMITKYIHTGQDTVFDMLSKLDFPENYYPARDLGLESYTAPRMDLYTQTTSDQLTIEMSLEELGSIIAVIESS